MTNADELRGEIIALFNTQHPTLERIAALDLEAQERIRMARTNCEMNCDGKPELRLRGILEEFGLFKVEHIRTGITDYDELHVNMEAVEYFASDYPTAREVVDFLRKLKE